MQDINDAPYVFVYKNKKPSLLHGENLYLKVNLKGKTETQLIRDFKKEIKHYFDFLESSTEVKQRDRKTDIKEGIWPVYDLYLETGKNKVETTRRWFDLSGSPGYDFDEKYKKQINTAISNAEFIINTIREEYNLKPLED